MATVPVQIIPAHEGNGWGEARFDLFQFYGRKPKAVSAKSGVSFSDFERMHVSRRVVEQVRRLGTPEWIGSNESVQRIILAYCERSLHIPVDETISTKKRLKEIDRKAKRYIAMYKPILDRQIYEHHAASKAGAAASVLKRMEIQLTNLDTRICVLAHLPAVLTRVIYFYYRMGYSSAQVAEEIHYRPPHVRQMLRKINLTWRMLQDGATNSQHRGRRQANGA